MIIYQWTGIESKALREAMQLTTEEFALAVQVSPRSIDAWESAGANASLRASSKRQLEKVLASAPDSVVARFATRLGLEPDNPSNVDRSSLATVTLANDTLGRHTLAVLGADEADQVWVPARTTAGEVILVSLPRRTIVTGIGVGALSAAVGIKPAAVLANTPDIDRLDHFRRLRLNLIESDNLHGSRDVIPLVEQSIERIGQLRRAGIGDPAGMQRMRVLYAEFAAWLHQDCRNWDRAQHWTDRALTWSHQLGDPYSIAATLIRKAQIANDMGEGDEALELAEAAERAAPPGTRFGAVAYAFAGQGCALSGNRGDSERAFDRARALADDASVDPSWGFFLDHSYIDVHQAQGRVALGDYQGAIDQFSRAISAMRSGQTRDQAVYVARQAVAYAKAGDAEPAARLGQAVLEIGVSTGSERILHNVRNVYNMIDHKSRQAEVVEFRAAAERWAIG
ncbi:helix-turn-helix transcriptional regulator [Nocardia sp. NPDC052112]|uniref:helix-turn-helix domain-containing protein n=1 Tax=Nocardia sp. NPDC052112 TaxID=3155646 RepID=UPI0034275083